MRKYVKTYVIENEKGEQITKATQLTDDCEIVGVDGGKVWRYDKKTLVYYNANNKLNLKPLGNIVVKNANTDEETVFYFKEKDFNEVERFLRKKNLGFLYRK